MSARKPLFMSDLGYSEEMAISDSMTLGGLTMGGNIDLASHRLIGVPDVPTAGGDAVNKNYVDAIAQGLESKGPVAAVSIANITSLSGLAVTVDGVDLDTDGMRVLLTAQTSGDAAIDNGIWVVHSGAWTRPTDFATGAHAAHAFVFAEDGTDYKDTGWVCTTNAPNDVIDTNNLAWVQFSSAGVITAGGGLIKAGNEISVRKGDGIEIVSNSAATNIDLATNPGLALTGTSPNKKLTALVASDGGIKIDGSNGLAAKLNGTTLQVGSSGLSVLGLPSLFQINGSAVSANVTAANLNTLTAGSGSNADALHVHSAGTATEAPKVENSLAVSEAVAVGDPVYFTNTNNRVGKGDTTDPKSNIIGVARTAQSTPGDTAEIVSIGPATGVLSGATAGDRYYLATNGGISTALPGAAKRVIRVGYAINGTDLWVEIADFGKKAA